MPKTEESERNKPNKGKLAMALPACNRNTQEAEAGELPQVAGQSRLHSECEASQDLYIKTPATNQTASQPPNQLQEYFKLVSSTHTLKYSPLAWFLSTSLETVSV